MTDRTGGKTCNYKLLSTTGVREVVSREPRPSVRGGNPNQTETVSSSSLQHSQPIDIVSGFAALSVSNPAEREGRPLSCLKGSRKRAGSVASAEFSGSPLIGSSNQESVSVASPGSNSLTFKNNTGGETAHIAVTLPSEIQISSGETVQIEDSPVLLESSSVHNDIFLSVATSLHEDDSESVDSDNHSIFEEDVFHVEEVPVVAPEIEFNVNRMALEQNRIQEKSFAGDIDDFMDENPLEDISASIPDLDDVIRGIESLRSFYRSKHMEVVGGVGEDNYEDELKQAFQTRLDSIKRYILDAKQCRKTLRDGEGQIRAEAVQQKKQKLTFLCEDVGRLMTDLENKFCESLSEESNDESMRRKNDLPQHTKDVQMVSKIIQDIVSAGETEAEVQRYRQRYEKLLSSKTAYVDSVHKEFDRREIEKGKSFKKSSLGIKLKPFKGYESVSDIYTFQDEFEKLHLRDTPSDSLPDLLKNNYLENPAKLLVKDVTDMDEIWLKLKSSYGDQKLLLSKKLKEFNQVEVSPKNKDSVEVLSKIVNLMKDLVRLAKRHSIENNLYYGDGLNQICHLLGTGRRRRWLEIACDITEEAEKWKKLIEFLEKELKVSQHESIIMAKWSVPKPSKGDSTHHTDGGDSSHYDDQNNQNIKVCFVCGESDHVQTNGPRGSKIVQYVACKYFAEMKPVERFKLLKTKGYCVQCLFPGADQAKGKHKEGKCQRDYVCKHASHERFQTKKHVLCCEEHKDGDENKETLQKFKERFVLRQTQLPDYSKNIEISHFCLSIPGSGGDTADGGDSGSLPLPSEGNESTPASDGSSLSADASSFVSQTQGRDVVTEESAVYMLQTIEINNELYNIFYDNGCKKFVCKFDAVKRLGSRAWIKKAGPFQLSGVGGITLEVPHGEYTVSLPRADGTDAVMTGLSIDEVTLQFPQYPLKGEVENDIRSAFHEHGKNLHQLPDLPAFVGGDTHFMIGIGFYRHFPDLIYRMPSSGLSIYKSKFRNPDGSFGVIGGQHAVFTQIESQYDLAATSFLSQQLQLFRLGFQVNPDVSLLGYRDDGYLCEPCSDEEPREVFYTKQALFEDVENAGSQISYRCVKCRTCRDCKNHERTEALSIREEVEQDVIDDSVVVDTVNRETIASLPLMADPAIKLAPNRSIAERSYYRQVSKVLRDPKDKAAIIKAEGALQSLGFVEWVKNLPPDVQKSLKENPVQNFIAWSAAWKLDSVTTPCRPVFNASQKTKSGYSLNDIVAKGKNGLNNLVEVFLRWRCHHVAFHNDLQKMYNKVKLRQKHWCLQRYLFQKDLDLSEPAEEKVITTCMYGIKSSGNQAQRGLRLTAEISMEEFPEAYDVIRNDTYVDDILSGDQTHALVDKRADELEIMLSRGGFSMKGFTVSGRPPDPSLSVDGVSIFTAGHVYYSEADQIALNIKELNFATKVKGRKTEIIGEVPPNLTRLQCTSKVHEIFDMTGLNAPIVATMKVSLHQLVTRKLQWDATLPNELMPIWHSHFEMMKEMKNVRYERAVIPPDAVNLEAETLDFGDASKTNVCAAIYVRFQKKDGSHSCQLLFARTKLVPDGMTQPRGELFAGVLNAHTGEVVRRALSKIHRKSIKFTDSQIVLFWISNTEKTLELWNRNRVVEIQRFTNISTWRYVASGDMIADIGTRPCKSIDEVSPSSVWINGYTWMKADESEFPMMTAEEVVIEIQRNKSEEVITTDMHMQHSIEEIPAIQEEVIPSKSDEDESSKMSKQARKVLSRYKFSKYIVDPNLHRFTEVIRLVAIMMTYMSKLQSRARMKSDVKPELSKEPVPTGGDLRAFVIPEEQINNAKNYYYKKATAEVRHFLNISQYKDISVEKDGLLLYTGRILPTDNVTIVGNATNVMKDLTATTFNVPIVDKYSPVAISISNDIHWYHDTAQHTGPDTVWRYVLQTIFIVEGRPLVNRIGRLCERCRYLNKRFLEVTMGAISGHNLTIAPAFYISQVDLAGPFTAYSPHNKRSTIKIWLSVWCCATTSTTSIKTMEDYSTSAFLSAFIRFACDAGYPKTLLVDAGSQVVKGCESMEIQFWDLRFKLHQSKSIDFEVCPVGGHNFNGKVERKIREVKKSITKAVSNRRLSLLQWETLGASISNSINNMPLALGSFSKSDLECMDLITPNRLKMGRNNERSPVGEVVFADNEAVIAENKAIFDAWFEVWLLTHVPKLMSQPKWFRSGKNLKPGDIVLFLKQESAIGSNYQFGLVDSVEAGRDNKVRKVTVRYRNHTEGVDRTTRRAARSLIVIRHADEMNIMDDLGDISRYVENKRRMHQSTAGECSKL